MTKLQIWLNEHSAVEAVNVAACKTTIPDLLLAIEIQAFVHYAVTRALSAELTK